MVGCHETCGAFPRVPCQPRAIINGLYIGQASLLHFAPEDKLQLMPGMAAPALAELHGETDDKGVFSIRYTVDGRTPHCARLHCTMIECSFAAVGEVYSGPVALKDLIGFHALPHSFEVQSVACDGAHRLSSTVAKSTVHVAAPQVEAAAQEEAAVQAAEAAALGGDGGSAAPVDPHSVIWWRGKAKDSMDRRGRPAFKASNGGLGALGDKEVKNDGLVEGGVLAVSSF